MTITEEERRLKTAEAALRDETCLCAAVPEITYEPGCIQIQCPRGCLRVCLPDFQPEEAVEEWKNKVR